MRVLGSLVVFGLLAGCVHGTPAATKAPVLTLDGRFLVKGEREEPRVLEISGSVATLKPFAGEGENQQHAVAGTGPLLSLTSQGSEIRALFASGERGWLWRKGEGKASELLRIGTLPPEIAGQWKFAPLAGESEEQPGLLERRAAGMAVADGQTTNESTRAVYLTGPTGAFNVAVADSDGSLEMLQLIPADGCLLGVPESGEDIVAVFYRPGARPAWLSRQAQVAAAPTRRAFHAPLQALSITVGPEGAVVSGEGAAKRELKLVGGKGALLSYSSGNEGGVEHELFVADRRAWFWTTGEPSGLHHAWAEATPPAELMGEWSVKSLSSSVPVPEQLVVSASGLEASGLVEGEMLRVSGRYLEDGYVAFPGSTRSGHIWAVEGGWVWTMEDALMLLYRGQPPEWLPKE